MSRIARAENIERRSLNPEKSMIAAMLNRAKLGYLNGDLPDYEREDLVEWLDHAGAEPFTFRWCCEQLGLLPEYTRPFLCGESA